MTGFGKPLEGEYAPYAIQYISLLPDDADLVTQLRTDFDLCSAFFRAVPPEKLTWRYAEGKWTIKEIICHLIDTERIYAYRALRFARKDETELPGYEQDDYVATSNANARGLGEMLDEFAAVRAATIALLRTFDADALVLGGIANGHRMTVRAAAYIIAGHPLHHMNIIEARYL